MADYILHPAPGSAIAGMAPHVPADLLEAVDTILETAPCDCSDKRRHERGEHLSGCYLFDLNIARGRMLAASGVPVSDPDRFIGGAAGEATYGVQEVPRG